MKQFFIVGCPRSGTTMVQQALNRHPLIAIPPETKFFFSLYRLPLRHQRRHLDRLNQDLDISLALPPEGIRNPAGARAAFAEMADQYLEQIGRQRVECFGEKTPEHTSRLGDIREVFPESKILFIYRDGRDVALSLSKMPWMPPDPCVAFCVWLYYYRILRTARECCAPNIAFVRYEDIVTIPREIFSSVFEFLGIPYCDDVVEGFGNTVGIPLRELPWKARALKPISADRVGLWRERFRAEEVEVVERLGRAALRELGYTLQTDGLAKLSWTYMTKLIWKLGCFAKTIPLCVLSKEFFDRPLASRLMVDGLHGGQAPDVRKEPMDDIPVASALKY